MSEHKWINWIVIGLLAIILAPLSGVTSTVAQPTDQTVGGYRVQFTTPEASVLPPAARKAIVEAMDAWPDSPPENNTFYLIALRWEGSWALATLTSANLEAPLPKGQHTHLNPSNLIALLLVQTEQGWQAAIDVDDRVRELLALVPMGALDQTARAAIFPPKEQIRRPGMLQQQYGNYKFPWPAGFAWHLTQCWHDTLGYPPGHALDFDILGYANSDILAAAPGMVVYMCKGSSEQYFLSVTTDGTSEQLGYLHLHGATVRAEGIDVGSHLDQGRKIGQMWEGIGGDECGISNGTHVHLNFPTKPFTIDNVTFTQSNCHWGEDLYSSQGGDPEPPDTSITSGPTGWIGVGKATFHWTGTDNQTPTPDLVYSYKLDGYAGWSGWTSSTGKTYNNLPDGPFTFRVKAKDKTGNVDPTPATRTFSVDTSPPSPPHINISGPGCSGIQNNAWQNTCYDPAFTWSASDSGSGVKDYYYYWGTSPIGPPDTQMTEASFDPGPIAPVDSYANYYLNVAARDNLDHESSVATFGVLYDGTMPTLTVRVNNGAEVAYQTTVLLNLSANDTGSGVAEVRVSNNGLSWSHWQPYEGDLPWTLPALNRHTLPVYVQVRDRAGNESLIVSDTIYLDLYPPMPHSDNYRICADVVDAGGSAGLSATNYLLTAAIGQPLATGAEANGSDSFDEWGGFLSSITGCLPITYPVPAGYTMTQSVVASGGNLRGSTNFRVGDTAGQAAASGATVLSSTSYLLSSGFWAGITSTIPARPPDPPEYPIPTPTPTPPPGPTPTPPPGDFGIHIDDDAPYTNDLEVIVHAWAPNATDMRLSNDPDYVDTDWFPYQITSTWTLSSTGGYVRDVYAWFRDAQGNVYGVYSDDIIYDAVAPEGRVEILGSESMTVTLWLEAYDTNSGLADMRISENSAMTDTIWQPYIDTLLWILQNPVVYAQYRDQAGNESPIYGSDGSVYWPDGYAVYLPLIFRHHGGY